MIEFKDLTAFRHNHIPSQV